VGYVEEDETPAMIMKKFEELERVMQAAAGARLGPEGPKGAPADVSASPCGPTHPQAAQGRPSVDPAPQPEADRSEPAALDESVLLEVFKRTR
jgi:hypothetical protein